MIKEVCIKHQVSLYDVDMKTTVKGKVLIVYITKIGGVLISDCKNVSRELNEIIDAENWIQGNYFLEVSSPGIERKLTQKKHYKSAINEFVKVTYQNHDKTLTIIGKLMEVEPDFIMVQNEDMYKIDFSVIKKASTIFIDKEKEKK